MNENLASLLLGLYRLCYCESSESAIPEVDPEVLEETLEALYRFALDQGQFEELLRAVETTALPEIAVEAVENGGNGEEGDPIAEDFAHPQVAAEEDE